MKSTNFEESKIEIEELEKSNGELKDLIVSQKAKIEQLQADNDRYFRQLLGSGERSGAQTEPKPREIIDINKLIN